MKKLALVSFVLGVSMVSALAADLPTHKGTPQPYLAPPIFTWTGLYIGINGGFIGSSNGNISNTGTDTGPGGLGSDLAVGAIPRGIGGNYSGGLVGGQIGYNWQFSQSWVAGLEADLDWVGARRNSSAVFPGGLGFVPMSTTYASSLDAFGTARARLGYLINPSFLLFGTGGAAFGETKLSSTYICAACAPPASTQAGTSSSSTGWRGGWTVGAGAEWKWSANWSVKAEYLYADLGRQSNTITYTYGGNTSSLTSSTRIHENVGRLGVNYSF
jgi:outer membrane immunogenic protein